MSKKKRIAIITPGFLPVPAVQGGAVERLITYLIEGNEKDPRYDFDVYTPSSPLFKQLQYAHCNIIQINTKGFPAFLLRCVHWLTRRLHCEIQTNVFDLRYSFVRWRQYDYILVENSMRQFEKLWHKKECQGKMLYHMHNDIEDAKGDKSPVRTKFVGENARLVLTVSDFIGHRVQEICSYANTRTLYNCIDIEKQCVDNHAVNAIKKQYHIEDSDIVVMYSGRIDYNKGLREMSRALLPLMEKDERIRFLVVGCVWFPNIMDSSYMDEVRKILNPVANRVIFTGFVDENKMPMYYHLCHILGIPSMCHEAFGLVTLEGMAASKPIVATKSGGMTEILDETCAIMVDKSPGVVVEELRTAFEHLIGNLTYAREMGLMGRKRFIGHKEWDKENYFREFYKCLEEVDLKVEKARNR